MDIRNPIEALIGTNGTAKVAGLSLLDLDSMTVRELRRHGLTAAQAGKVKAAFDLGRQLLEAEASLHDNAPIVSTPEDAYRYMRPKYVNEYRETLRRADDGQPEQADPSSPGVHRQPNFLNCSPARGIQAGHPGERRLGHFLPWAPYRRSEPFSRGRGDHPPAPPGGRGDGDNGVHDPRGLRTRPFSSASNGRVCYDQPTFRRPAARHAHEEGQTDELPRPSRRLRPPQGRTCHRRSRRLERVRRGPRHPPGMYAGHPRGRQPAGRPRRPPHDHTVGLPRPRRFQPRRQ